MTGGLTASISYSYDGLLRPSDTQYTLGTATLYRVQPVYDPVGAVAGVTTTLPQGVDTQVFCTGSQDRLTWAGSSGTPPCASSLTPASFTGASYSASYTYDAGNRLRSGPLGAYSYTNNSHVDAATAIGGTAWTAAYDAAGNLICRAPSSATTCSGTPSGAQLTYDNEGRLATWQRLSQRRRARLRASVAVCMMGVRPLVRPGPSWSSWSVWVCAGGARPHSPLTPLIVSPEEEYP